MTGARPPVPPGGAVLTGEDVVPSAAAPVIARQYAAASAAYRTSTPGAARPVRSGDGSRPFVAFRPITPHQAAGIRTEPAPSLPVASGTSPAATAAADPAEDPPGVRSARHGLTVRPYAPTPQVCHGVPGPGTAVAPTGTQPAASNGPAARSPCRPLTPIGTPASGSRSPAATRASTARARSTAAPSHTSAKELSEGSTRVIRASASVTASTARSRPSRTAEAIPTADGARPVPPFSA